MGPPTAVSGSGRGTGPLSCIRVPGEARVPPQPSPGPWTERASRPRAGQGTRVSREGCRSTLLSLWPPAVWGLFRGLGMLLGLRELGALVGSSTQCLTRGQPEVGGKKVEGTRFPQEACSCPGEH